jgi:hypothetical protein
MDYQKVYVGIMDIYGRIIPTDAQNTGREDIHSLRKFLSYLITVTYIQG